MLLRPPQIYFLSLRARCSAWPLGELFVLAPPTEGCARDQRYEFLLILVPLHVEGGTASPPNLVAIK